MAQFRIIPAFWVLGCSATAIQVLILRELFVLLSGNELCFGLALGVWLIGIAVGALVAVFLVNRGKPSYLFSGCLAAGPILALGSVLAIRMLRSFLQIPFGEQISPGLSLILSFLCVAPLGMLVGIAFPLAVTCLGRNAPHAETSSRPVGQTTSTVYAWESFGSLAAGALISFYLVGRFGTVEILLWTAVLTSVVASLLFLPSRLGETYLLVAGILALVVATDTGKALEQWSNLRRWQGFGYGDWVLSRDTPYQHFDLGRAADQFNLYSNGSLLFSFPDPYTEQISAHLWMSLHSNPRSVLLIGGMGGRYLPPILDHRPERVDYVEPDRVLVEMVRNRSEFRLAQILDSDKVHVHITDARRFVRETEQRYDLVIVDLPDPSTALLNRYYTKEFYSEIRDILAPDGRLVTGVEAPSTYLAGELGTYTASIFWTLQSVFEHVGLLPDGNLFMVASSAQPPSLDQPEVFVDRLRSRRISSSTFAPEAILNHILPQRAKAARNALDQLQWVPRNTDFSPQSYLRKLVLWSRESGGDSLADTLDNLGSWRRFLLVMLLLAASVPWVFLGMVPKRVSLFTSVATVGCAGMGLELVAIYMYQNLYGYLYREIGFLVAVFMAGLTVGAILGRWIAHLPNAQRILIRVLFGMAGFTFLFPFFLWGLSMIQPGHSIGLTVYGGLILVTGCLVGVVFPVAVAVLAERQSGDGGKVVAFADAADHLGGALGAFLPGILLFPLFGVFWICVLLGVGLACVATGFLMATYLESPYF